MIEIIKTCYRDYVTEEELNNLDTMSANDLKQLVINIWKRYLDKNNMILVARVSPLVIITIDEGEDLNDSIFGLTVLSRNNPSFSFGEMGLIVNINWDEVKDIEKDAYLPMDFLKEKRNNISLNIRGVLFINYGEGELSSVYENAKLLAECLNTSLTVINKENPKLDNEYYDYIAKEIISLYLIETEKHIGCLQELFEKYGANIIKKYKEAKASEDYSIDSFKQEVFSYLDSLIYIK